MTLEQAWEFVAASCGEDATQERGQQGTRWLVAGSEFQSQRI